MLLSTSPMRHISACSQMQHWKEAEKDANGRTLWTAQKVANRGGTEERGRGRTVRVDVAQSAIGVSGSQCIRWVTVQTDRRKGLKSDEAKNAMNSVADVVKTGEQVVLIRRRRRNKPVHTHII